MDSRAWQVPNPRTFTWWSHPGAMLFGHWSPRKSLRELVFSVNRQVRKCYHLGLAAVQRSTLADPHRQRPAVIFEKICYRLDKRLSAGLVYAAHQRWSMTEKPGRVAPGRGRARKLIQKSPASFPQACLRSLPGRRINLN